MTAAGANLFINREVSWLEFNARVLEEALDESVPLLERLKFLAIVSSNLDEFFMVRVAGIKRQIEAEVVELSPNGMTPRQQDEAISERVHAMVERQYAAFKASIRPALADSGVVFARVADLDETQRLFLGRWFAEHVFPVLTPMAVDPAHPFPVLLNTNLYLAVRLAPSGARQIRGSRLAFVQVPEVISRVVEVPNPSGAATFVFLEDVIGGNIASVFEGYDIVSAHPLRVTRDADLTIDEEGAEDLLKAIEYELRRRPRGAAVRLEIDAATPEPLVAELMKALDLHDSDVYAVDGPLSLKPLMRMVPAIDRPDLKEPICPPVPTALGERRCEIWRMISRGNICSTTRTTRSTRWWSFLEDAADDPDVLAIKQTLYRTAGTRPSSRPWPARPQNGKQVTALVELKARFDEETNIHWASALEEAGVHVVYGLVGLKTHCKAAARRPPREPSGIRRYVHLSTGNYNAVDGAALHRPRAPHGRRGLRRRRVGALQPAHRLLAAGVATAGSCAAPFDLHERVLELINREARPGRAPAPRPHHRQDERLVDREVIDALYRGLARRREDRPHRPRHLLPAARRAGHRATTSASPASSTASSSTAASSTSTTAGRTSTTSRAPTGCLETSSAASSLCFRSPTTRTRRSSARYSTLNWPTPSRRASSPATERIRGCAAGGRCAASRSSIAARGSVMRRASRNRPEGPSGSCRARRPATVRRGAPRPSSRAGADRGRF